MKSYIQQKRKRGDIIRNQDECLAITIKKPANGTGQGPQSGLEGIMVPHLDPPIQLQIPSAKLKLQLFPINKQTRLGLEKDGYNPFLEITLSAQKRISSVVRHLDTKWGCSSKVTGQLMLFPYYTKSEQLASCRRWTLNDSSFTVWEVYVDVGSPSIFRLRYGWLCNHQMGMFGQPPKSSLLEAHTGCEDEGSLRMVEIPNHQEERVNDSCEVIKRQSNAVELRSDANHQEEQVNDFCVAIRKQSNYEETFHSDANELKASDVPSCLGDDKMTMEAIPVCPIVPWDDNLTMLSIGGLLSEISLQGKINGSDPSSISRHEVQPTSLTSAISFHDLLSEASLFGKMRCASAKLENDSSLKPLFLGSSDISIGGLFSEASLLSNKNKSDTQSTEAGHAQVQSPWDDSFTTLSIGGLLSEASLQAKTGCKVELKDTKSSLEPFAPSQSLDFLTFSQLCAPSQKPKLPMQVSNLSILDAEETCHAFPIQKHQSSGDIRTSNARVGSGGCSTGTSFKQSHFPRAAKIEDGTVFPKDSSRQGLETGILTRALGTFDEDSCLWPFRHQSAGAG